MKQDTLRDIGLFAVLVVAVLLALFLIVSLPGCSGSGGFRVPIISDLFDGGGSKQETPQPDQAGRSDAYRGLWWLSFLGVGTAAYGIFIDRSKLVLGIGLAISPAVLFFVLDALAPSLRFVGIVAGILAALALVLFAFQRVSLRRRWRKLKAELAEPQTVDEHDRLKDELYELERKLDTHTHEASLLSGPAPAPAPATLRPAPGISPQGAD